MDKVEFGELHGAWFGDEPPMFRLDLDFPAKVGKHQAVIPKGFTTDGASIPKAFQNIFNPWGKWREEAVWHDFLYTTKGAPLFLPPPNGKRVLLKCDGTLKVNPTDAEVRLECDRSFLLAMKAGDVSWLARSIIFRAVRLGGGFVWSKRKAAEPMETKIV